MSAVLSVLLLTTPAFAQTKSSNTANSDPVVCFDDVLRDAENALQAYSIALTKSWAQEADCKSQAPSATELASCWDLLLQARPLISQAGRLNEQARRTSSPADADRLSQQAGALMRQAADLVRKARDCFNPVFAQWQKNGGRYIAANGGTSESGASSAPQVPTSVPPVGPSSPGPRRPAASPSSPATLSVRIAAHKAADTIVAGNDSRAALGELNKAQQALPPSVPRPIQCWGMMVDAASKRNVEPSYAIPQAQRAAACYDGEGVDVSGRQQPETTSPRNRPIACSVQRPKGDPVAEFPWTKEDADALYQYGVFEGVTDCIADPTQLCPLVAGLALGRIKLAAEILGVLGNLQAAQALLEGPPPHSTNPNIIKRGIEDGRQYCAYYTRVVGGAVRKGPARPPTARPTETPAATPVPSDATIINDSTSDRYIVWDSSNPQFKAFAHVEDDEIFINLRTELETANGVVKSSVLRGREQFQKILQFFTGRFKGIRGSWSFGTNLEAFNKAITAGMSPVEAALKTWTGQQAKDAGYSRVVIRSLEGPAGHYSKVTVSFFHP